MGQTPKRVAVIGLDCALPQLIEKHIAEGNLPTLKRLIDGGVIAENCLVPYPTVTPPNWATIATGASLGTHGITDFHYHEPGTPLVNVVQSFSSERWLAEPIWDTADRAGKKCIVLNYPGAWPSHMKNGIMVGGAGLTVGELRDGQRYMNSVVLMCGEQLITTGAYPGAAKGEFVPAADWRNAPEMGEAPLEMAARLVFGQSAEAIKETTWYVLARQSGGAKDGYDTVTLSPTKDLGDAFCTLGVGEWSRKLWTTVTLVDETTREVCFRCKLVAMSDDAEDFRLYVTGLIATSGWAVPAEVVKEIASEEGIPCPSGGLLAAALGWIELNTYTEINAIHDLWLGDAAVALLTGHDWDVFFMHSHPPDWMYHAILTDMDDATCKDAARREKAWDAHLKIYKSQDRMLGRILAATDEDTLVILVSDHGATADGPAFNPYDALVPAGLAAYRAETTDVDNIAHGRAAAPRHKTDHARSKAIVQRGVYIYVHLKGRDPGGIVEPEDHEVVQQQIIDALLTYVDPETGRRPVALALSKKDARILGLYGDRIGDVVYALNPWFGSQHQHILPTGEFGIGSLKGLLVMKGPGIKAGARLARTCGLQDIVPTICYLMELPLPDQVEGAVLYQALEDPNSKLDETLRLRERLRQTEVRLA